MVTTPFDFNQAGQEYQAIAVGRPGGFGMLADGPAALLERLREHQALQYRGASAEGQRAVLGAAGCLHRLEGFLFQLSRVAAHAESLRTWTATSAGLVGPQSGTMAVHSADEACFDYEGLLLQARAALDRLTWFITSQYRDKCNRFSRLKAVLRNFAKSDPRAAAILRILDTADSFAGVLVDADGTKALRSKIAHYSSVPEGRQIAFTIHFMHDGRRLILDCEALGWPLLATSYTLGVNVPFLVLNTVATYSDIECVELAGFKSMWVNPSVSFTAYRDESPDSLKLTVANMLPDGFSIATQSLRRGVLERAIP